MSKFDKPILIVSDNESELEEIKQHLSVGFTHVFHHMNESEAIHTFEEKKAAVLLLNFQSLRKAEAFYLKLFRSSENIYDIPHQVIVFVTRSDLERAYELCRREIFHSFIIVRPMLSEHFLRIAVLHALEKRESHNTINRGRTLLKRLADQVERLRSEFNMLITNSTNFREKESKAHKGLADSIHSRLGVFRDSLMGPEMKNIVTVHNAAALDHEFERLHEVEILTQLNEYHGKMDEAMKAWTIDMEKNLSLLEMASSDITLTQQLEPPHILVIDDDKIQRHMLNSLLQAEGYEVREAANGNEGMSLIQSSAPDLVLLDYEMPELNGVDLLKKVRSSPEFKGLPIIMLTGHQEKEVVKQCLENGANDYLVKPVTVKSLHDRLDHFVSRPVPQAPPIIQI